VATRILPEIVEGMGLKLALDLKFSRYRLVMINFTVKRTPGGCMNRKIVFVVAVLAAILVPLALLGQEKKQEKKDAGSVSVTGCFNKGADADHYVLKDEKGKEYVVTGDAAMLARHANNHRVTISGNMAKEKDKEVLKATNLQMLAVCQ
jgi:uncharacterized protein YdeI (BOF family)